MENRIYLGNTEDTLLRTSDTKENEQVSELSEETGYDLDEITDTPLENYPTEFHFDVKESMLEIIQGAKANNLHFLTKIHFVTDQNGELYPDEITANFYPSLIGNVDNIDNVDNQFSDFFCSLQEFSKFAEENDLHSTVNATFDIDKENSTLVIKDLDYSFFPNYGMMY